MSEATMTSKGQVTIPADIRRFLGLNWFFKQKGSPDFADCLHAVLARQAGQAPFLTFDRQASSLDGATLLR